MKRVIALEILATEDECMDECPFLWRSHRNPTFDECELFGVLVGKRSTQCKAAERRAKNRKRR